MRRFSRPPINSKSPKNKMPTPVQKKVSLKNLTKIIPQQAFFKTKNPLVPYLKLPIKPKKEDFS